jgi:hypothetical protein
VPERAVDEHDVARGEPGDHAVVEPGEPGNVGDGAPAVTEYEAARLELHTLEVARGVAARGEGLDLEARAVEMPGFERPPLGAAVALEHRQHGIALPQRAADAFGAVDADRRRRLAHEEQSGRVVDLRVGQQHARDRRRADAVHARAEHLELLRQVRRRVDEEPRPVAGADRERRLGPRRALTRARRVAHPAAAVPLRIATAGGGAEDADAHAAGCASTAGTGRK